MPATAPQTPPVSAPTAPPTQPAVDSVPPASVPSLLPAPAAVWNACEATPVDRYALGDSVMVGAAEQLSSAGFCVDAAQSRFGSVHRQGFGSGRTGNHTDGDAWAILAPRSGHARDLTRPARVTDIAATVAALCGLPLDGLRGEPLLER